MRLIVVESPAKIHTISKYLNNNDYVIAASYGHIAELEAKGTGIDIKNDFNINLKYNPHKNIKDLIDKAKKSTEIYLASDFDREGEKIAYDVKNYLLQKKYVKKSVNFYRITFNEITKDSILKAIENKHEINLDLVHAQEARSTIDYLFGFNLSPVLWYKLPGAKSAGRVQSVALRMICEREDEIRHFIPEEYWTINGVLEAGIEAKLDLFDNKKVEKFSFRNLETTKAAVDILSQQRYSLKDVVTKKVERAPYAPFITSTLQREAYLRYGFSVKKTMQIAQRLYEGTQNFESLITYMRTDSFNLSEYALQNIRQYIDSAYGKKYLASDAVVYLKKIKNAQEAHEAIRPIDVRVTPNSVNLDDDERKIYTLIWKRTVACQMSNSIKENISYQIFSDNMLHKFSASYSVELFDGFVKVYDYLKSEHEKSFNIKEVNFTDFIKKQHFTEPPARYNEASLIENLEKYGIGRPSTYATIISTIIERNYVSLEDKKLIPSSLGEIVIIFLKKFFATYVDFYFTGNVENELDKIANGEEVKLKVLNDFWHNFERNVEEVKKIATVTIMQNLQEDFKRMFNVNKKCKKCDGGLTILIGKYGPYLSCSSYPTCQYIENIFAAEEQSLGEDSSGNIIYLKQGKYGYYVEAGGKRADVSKTKENTTLEDALNALAFPRNIGKYENDDVIISYGKFGYYAKIGGIFVSISTKKALTIELPEVIDLYFKKKNKKEVDSKTKV